MPESSRRDILTDALKAYAIILVVCGHAIQYAVNNPDDVFLYRAIYSFHMPLFMLISGMNTSRSAEYDLTWLVRKFRTLIIPFVIWIFVPYLFAHTWDDIGAHLLVILRRPDHAYWFLLSLFLNHLMFWLLRKIIKTSRACYEFFMDIMVVAVWTIINAFTDLILGLNQFAWFYTFYIVGYYITRYQLLQRLQHQRLVAGLYILCGAVWYLCMMGYHRADMNEITVWLITRGYISGITIQLTERVLSYLIAFAGIGWSLCLIRTIINHLLQGLAGNAVSLIGKSTMEIYILHYYFLNLLPFRNVIAGTMSNVIIGLGIPLFIAITCRNNMLNQLLFGR